MDKIKIMRNKIVFLAMMLLFVIIIPYPVNAAENNVCCEKTSSGLFCQNVPQEQCAQGSRQAPTSCGATSFCKPGVCYGAQEGLCLENTPQIACNSANGSWSEGFPAQCNLGCCVLGDQAAFVSLVRCKRLSSFLGLQTNFNRQIADEVSCVQSVQNQDKGACVYEFEFEKTCTFATRADCAGGINGTGAGAFYKGKLCTAPELGTKCERTRRTTCLPGKDEVYFVDTCGNPGNIYDTLKIENNDYWSNLKDSSSSCNPNSGNSNSKTCGNCNYLQGSICRKAETGNKANYGDNICADLNCAKTSNGKSYKHGESWCIYKDAGTKNAGKNSVGSRYYRHLCINGDEVLEQCADFRQEECIEGSIQTPVGPFSQAACRVNRWQDCVSQTDKRDCENSDRRDCIWKPNLGLGNSTSGVCLPKNSPGLKFWEGEDAKSICAQGNIACLVVFEKGLFGNEECKQNCECLADNWVKQRIDICNALGDCGPNVNWINQQGYKEGYNVTIGRA